MNRLTDSAKTSERNTTLEEVAKFIEEVADGWKGRKEADEAVKRFAFVMAKNIREMKE